MTKVKRKWDNSKQRSRYKFRPHLGRDRTKNDKTAKVKRKWDNGK